MQKAKRASELRGVVPEAVAEPATTASGTVAENAACWEEGATGVAAAAESPCQAAQAVAAAAPPCFRGHQYDGSEISRSARGKVQSKTNIFHGFTKQKQLAGLLINISRISATIRWVAGLLVHCVHYIKQKDSTARFATGAI